MGVTSKLHMYPVVMMAPGQHVTMLAKQKLLIAFAMSCCRRGQMLTNCNKQQLVECELYVQHTSWLRNHVTGKNAL